MNFQAIFQLQVMFTTNIIPGKYTENVEFDAKQFQKVLSLSCWLTHWNKLSHYNFKAYNKEEKNHNFRVRSIFIYLMNSNGIKIELTQKGQISCISPFSAHIKDIEYRQ